MDTATNPLHKTPMQKTTTTTTQAIFRVVLTNKGENTAFLDPQAKLTAAQPHPKGVECYFLVNPDLKQEDLELRTFLLVGTGQAVEGGTFLATVAFPMVKAQHLFEI